MSDEPFTHSLLPAVPRPPSSASRGGVAAPSAARSHWRAATAAAAGVALSLLFLASGLWKLLDLDAASERMVQSLVPAPLSAPAAMAVAALEALAGILLVLPRSRRWGAWLAAVLLIAFMVYIGVFYNRLLGDDCNCFPWIKRVVGPAFFAGDAAMLLLAMIAGIWSGPSAGLRQAGIALAVVCSLVLGSYAAASFRRGRTSAPALATVDGKTIRLREGRVLLYFFDPECTHCYAVAGQLAKQNWGATRIVVVPTREPQFASSFLEVTTLKAGVSPDVQLLRDALPFTDPPYAVALHDGNIAARFNSGEMEQRSFLDSLRRLGYVR